MNRPQASLTSTGLVGALLLAMLPAGLLAQLAPYAFPPRQPLPSPLSKISITYGGTIVMDLGNYDVVLRTPYVGDRQPPLTTIPGLLGHDAGPFQTDDPVEQPLPQIIYKDSSGMRWDGRNYFYHPAYPYETVAPFIYKNRIVGRPDEYYPPPQQADTLGSPGTRTRLPSTQPCPQGRYAFTDPLRPLGPQVEHFGFDSAAITVNPFPLPESSAESLSEFCKLYPFAVQCGPVYWGEAGLTPKLVPKSSGTLKAPSEELAKLDVERSAKTEVRRPRIPDLDVVPPEPNQLPIVIVNSATASDACSYTLRLEGRESAFSLLPGQKQEFWADRDWLIRFNTNGLGIKKYRLRPGRMYEFTQDQSGVWGLHRQPDAGASLIDPTRLPQAAPEPDS